MILIASRHSELAENLCRDLTVRGYRFKLSSPDHAGFLNECYHHEVSAIVTDEESPNFPFQAYLDLFNSLGRRVSVLVIRDKSRLEEMKHHKLDAFTDQITILPVEQYDNILSTVSLFAGQLSQGIKAAVTSIPFYSPQVSVSMLRDFGGLGILTIDASGLNKISLEYGQDVYKVMKRVLHDVLFNLWGANGCIREDDILCRRSSTSNTFLVLMNRGRKNLSLPFPGALERIADRLSSAINNAMWQELFAPKAQKRIPECVQTVPLIGVGFYGVLYNPCIEIHETIDGGLEASKQMAQAQLKRGRERQRELMQTLIQSDELLTSHFQGVFKLQEIDEAMVKKAAAEKNIAVLGPHLYGFEALIRVNKDAVNSHNSFDTGLDSRYLNPDVLFSLAKYTNLALELDQACMRHAANDGNQLPGTLMVNILPRNLYYIEKLKVYFKKTDRLMFEVSESEAINNLELMQQSREHLEQHSMGIAADDFGQGYSSLDRIIKIRPDVIKFDRGLIQDIHKDSVKQAYVKGLVASAKMLNTVILAEGVELWEEASLLKDMGIELIQGYLLHRPQPLAVIEAQLGITDATSEESEKQNVA